MSKTLRTPGDNPCRNVDVEAGYSRSEAQEILSSNVGDHYAVPKQRRTPDASMQSDKRIVRDLRDGGIARFDFNIGDLDRFVQNRDRFYEYAFGVAKSLLNLSCDPVDNSKRRSALFLATKDADQIKSSPLHNFAERMPLGLHTANEAEITYLEGVDGQATWVGMTSRDIAHEMTESLITANASLGLKRAC